MPTLSRRLASLPPYAAGAAAARKRELLARGVDVIDLGAGDADLPPPPAAVERLRRAATEPTLQRYGFGVGHWPFREAAAAFMRRRFGVSVDAATEIVPLLGSKEGIAHLALAVLNPGDVAVVPEPGYICYAGGTLLADGVVHAVPLRREEGFLVDLDALPADVLRRTRLVYLNYPNNPTAAVAPREYLERVVARCRELDAVLVYDNAYSELAFDGYVPPSIFEIPGADEVAVEFHSLSKTYNMTGWRCGWAVARPPLAAALARVKQFVDTGQYLGIQAAGVAALESWEEFVPQNVARFRERRDAAVAAFAEAGFAVETPAATMYLWVPLPEGLPSALFAERLLEDEGVMVLPGSSFGAGGEGFFRVSFITAPERLAEAARRAGRVLRALESRV